jgi:tetratricopeptide (TPR) repeat protein
VKKSCAIGILAAWGCAAMQMTSPESIEASMRADMRGDAEMTVSRPGGATNPASRQLLLRAGAERAVRLIPPVEAGSHTVSAAQLKHKVPREAQKAFNRAWELSRAGKHELAARELEKAVTRDAEYIHAHNNLGIEYTQLGRFGEAAAELERAIALDPNSVGYYNLSLVYFQTGDLGATEKCVRQAVELPESEPLAHLFLAMLLMPDPHKRDEVERHLRYAAPRNQQAAELLHELQASK